MQIHSITIDNIRSIEHLELRDIPASGVCMISGPNEVGKSTIVEAIDLVLSEKSTAQKKWIKSMRRVGSTEPMQVSLEATIGDQHFTISKQFLNKPTARLVIHSPNPRTYTGDQANDELLQIIDEHLDSNLHKLLFVKQGALDHTLGEVGFNQLEKPLQLAGAGDGAGIAQGSQSELMAKVRDEVSRYYTKTGKPSKELKHAQQEVEDATKRHAEARAAITDLSAQLENYEAAEAELARLKPQIPELKQQVEASQREVVRAEKRESERERLQTKKDVEEQKKQRIEERKKQRARAAEELAASAQRVTECERTQQELELQAKEHAEKIEGLRSALDAAVGAEQSARADYRVWEQHQHAVRERIRHQKDTEFLAQYDEYTAEISQQKKKLPEDVPSGADIARAEEIAEKIVYAQATVAAASSTLTLSAAAGAEIAVNGEPQTLSDTATVVQVSERTTLRIGEVDAVIEPAANVAAEKDALDQLIRERDQLCTEFEVDSVQQLKQIATTAESITADIARLKKARTRHAGKRDVDDIRDAVEKFQAAELPEGISADEAGEKALEERLHELRTAVEQADAATAKARTNLEEARTSRIDQDAAVAREKLKDAIDEQKRRAQALEAAEQEHSDEAEEEELRSLDAHLATLSAALQALEEDDSVLSLEKARRAAEQDETLLKNTEGHLEEAYRRQSEIKGSINAFEGAAEKEKIAKAELERRESILARTQHKADVAKLLLDTLERHYRDVTQRYAKPIREELERLAAQLHEGDVSYEFDETGLVGRVIREEQLSVDELSGGASEQVGLMLRLAIANLAANNADSDGVDTVMPVIMDDALGNSDVLRLKRLSGLIEREAASKQIFLMTCDPQRFAAIGKRKEYRVEELKRAANETPLSKR
ncbi:MULTISPECIES: AAA family ATPase [Corynebacterium]|uniref:AAA family ATPase n=1 Tax=Corynebacterium TaxID=1716 RepID=UPI00124E596D|nr:MULTISPECIES: AAA family ATPase [Corynebacterium]